MTDQIPETPPVPTPQPIQIETISGDDRANLAMWKMRQQLALAEAKQALAQNEAIEAGFRYMMLELYVKYGLSPNTDRIDEQGNIIRKQKEAK